MITSYLTRPAISDAMTEASPSVERFNKVEVVTRRRYLIGRGVLAGLLALGIAVLFMKYSSDREQALAKVQQEEMAQMKALFAQSAPDTASPRLKVERPGWCGKATTHVEKMICTNNDLSDLDLRMDAIYKVAKRRAHDSKNFYAASRAWRNIQRDVCSTKNCLIKAYQWRIYELSAKPLVEPALSKLVVQQLSPAPYPTLVELPEPGDVAQESGV